ncbi:aminopeptidase, partial [Chloroflexota bacterium]
MSGASRVIEVMRAAKWVIEHNVKKGQHVAILTNPTVPQEIPTALAAAAASIGAIVVTVYFPTPSVPSEEPPKTVLGIMKSADVVISAAAHSVSFTRAKLESAKLGGIHIGSPGDEIDSYVKGCVEVYFDESEFQKMHERGLWLADLLMKANEVRITSENGTDIKGSIRGRVPFPSTGITFGPYTGTAFPSGEVMLPPVEGTSEGVVVLDTSMGGIGRITTPIRLTVKEGKVYEIAGGEEADRLRRLVENAGEGGDNLAEFGIGLNT